MNIELYHKTLLFVAEAHQKQFFPATQLPYLLHLLQVYEEVRNAIFHEKVQNTDLALLSAFLHDTIEDTALTEADIEKNFGKEVAKGVLALTKNPHLPKNERMADSLKRILDCPPEIALVKMCDRICNLQKPPIYWEKQKIETYRQEAVFIWESLKDAHSFAANRLSQKIEAYKIFL